MVRRTLLLLSVPLLLEAQATRDSVVSTTVTRTVRVAPDRATLFVGIDGTAETAREAVARAEAKVAQVRDALTRAGAGVELGPAVTVSVGPSPNMRGFPSPSVASSYSARVAMRLTVTRLTALATSVAAALDAGAAQGSYPAFESSQADSVRRAVAAEALPIARRELEAVAAGLGGQLGALLEVSTSTMDRSPGVGTMIAFDGSFGGPTIPPDVAFTVNITVRYRLVR
ncbi:MAG: SIMPL domain-containing protein [Gemmatimonadaceae bacterium]|jgi:uncharacterized protein YggE|nr:SIMPL domain-containing protein [Gemmatimonadaceae bacterium]